MAMNAHALLLPSLQDIQHHHKTRPPHHNDTPNAHGGGASWMTWSKDRVPEGGVYFDGRGSETVHRLALQLQATSYASSSYRIAINSQSGPTSLLDIACAERSTTGRPSSTGCNLPSNHSMQSPEASRQSSHSLCVMAPFQQVKRLGFSCIPGSEHCFHKLRVPAGQSRPCQDTTSLQPTPYTQPTKSKQGATTSLSAQMYR